MPGIRVAGDRDAGHRVGPAAAALGVADRLHLLDLAPQLGDAGVDPAAVELDLGLTRSARAHALAAGGLATGLPRHRLTPAAQARQEVLQLGQLDLRLALSGLRVLGEDVEDEGGAVDDLDLDDVLEGAALAGRELGVADDGVGALGDDDVAQLDGLALAQVGRGVGVGAALHDAGEHLGARRSRRARRARAWSSRRPRRCPRDQTDASTTRSSRSWRYSTSVTSSSSVESPETRRSAARSSRSSCSPSKVASSSSTKPESSRSMCVRGSGRRAPRPARTGCVVRSHVPPRVSPGNAPRRTVSSGPPLACPLRWASTTTTSRPPRPAPTSAAGCGCGSPAATVEVEVAPGHLLARRARQGHRRAPRRGARPAARPAPSSTSAAAGGRSPSPWRSRSPAATVHAVDVNERALDLTRRNAAALGLDGRAREHRGRHPG